VPPVVIAAGSANAIRSDLGTAVTLATAGRRARPAQPVMLPTTAKRRGCRLDLPRSSTRRAGANSAAKWSGEFEELIVLTSGRQFVTFRAARLFVFSSEQPTARRAGRPNGHAVGVNRRSCCNITLISIADVNRRGSLGKTLSSNSQVFRRRLAAVCHLFSSLWRPR
jgi:hypothetical protein